MKKKLNIWTMKDNEMNYCNAIKNIEQLNDRSTPPERFLVWV